MDPDQKPVHEFGDVMFTAIVLIVIALAAVLMMPHPKSQNQPPPGFGDIQVPQAQEGANIPVLFGTKMISGQNVTWDGDYRTVPVQSSS